MTEVRTKILSVFLQMWSVSEMFGEVLLYNGYFHYKHIMRAPFERESNSNQDATCLKRVTTKQIYFFVQQIFNQTVILVDTSSLG